MRFAAGAVPLTFLLFNRDVKTSSTLPARPCLPLPLWLLPSEEDVEPSEGAGMVLLLAFAPRRFHAPFSYTYCPPSSKSSSPHS